MTATSPGLVLTAGVVVDFYRPSTADVTVLPQGVPIAGTNGTDGVNGTSIRSGTGAPTVGAFSTGDMYIDLVYPNTLYGPRAIGGTWPTVGPLVGPAGPSGSGVHGFIMMGG